jgi:hypothetical protein
MPKLSPIDWLLFPLAILSLIATVIYYFTAQSAFADMFAIEDGPVEWGTAICLFLSSLVLLRNALSLNKKRGFGAALMTGFFAFLFFFASGEEISWGQRIFGWDSGAFFKTANAQQQTNIHNLVIGNVSLAKTVFGSGLTVVLLLYLVVLPLIYSVSGLVKRIINRLVIPAPDFRHTVVTLLATAVMASINMLYQWEVYEFVFSLMAVSVFLRPRNAAQVT